MSKSTIITIIVSLAMGVMIGASSVKYLWSTEIQQATITKKYCDGKNSYHFVSEKELEEKTDKALGIAYGGRK